MGEYARESVKCKSPHPRRFAQALGTFARASACLLLLLGQSQAEENVLSLSDRDALISWALEHYWGRARDSTGAVIQPSSDLDRRTAPIPPHIANRALEAGEVSGLGAWCGLDWESHYHSLTAAARQRKMPDKQIAFISVLHGLAQGITLRSKNSPCSESERQLVTAKLNSSKSIGIGDVF